jgi:predicted double-glycine peptidase
MRSVRRLLYPFGMRITLASALSMVALAACTTHTSNDPTATTDAAIKLPDGTIPVPIVAQQTDFTCGDVATLAVLRFWKNADYANVPETSLYAPLMTTRQDGTEPYAIATYLQTIPGMHAEYKTGADGVQLSDLQAAVDRGEPPIVDVQAWRSNSDPYSTDWSDGHFAVLIGYDSANLFFMDPSMGGHYGYIAIADVMARWHDDVGTNGTPTDHVVVFVHGDGPSYWETPIPPSAAPIP